jgi:predicted nucleotidyltransferase
MLLHSVISVKTEITGRIKTALDRKCDLLKYGPASMIPPAVRDEIQSRLRRAESEHDVKVLLAVESGSRAWGFASPNSDYDARFIYVHQPNWYLAVDLEEKRDVIEYAIVDDLDVNGWDVRKALRLFWKSNPGFIEWIQSPILYEASGSFHAQALRLLPDVYSVEAGIYHYRSMAKTNYRSYLQENLVPLKKYFYVLRPLLAVRWLERFGKPAPIEFNRLLTVLEGQREASEAIHRLLEVKTTSPEMGLSAPVPTIHRFIEGELLRLEQIAPSRSKRQRSASSLSEVFRSVLRDAWGLADLSSGQTSAAADAGR